MPQIGSRLDAAFNRIGDAVMTLRPFSLTIDELMACATHRTDESFDLPLEFLSPLPLGEDAESDPVHAVVRNAPAMTLAELLAHPLPAPIYKIVFEDPAQREQIVADSSFPSIGAMRSAAYRLMMKVSAIEAVRSRLDNGEAFLASYENGVCTLSLAG